MSAFMALPSIRFGEKPALIDRPDLGCVVIYPDDQDTTTQMQVSDVATARAHALAWAQAADMLAAQEQAKAPVPLAELRDAPHYTEPPQESTCGPGGCTCGAHVSADGTVTPAGAM